MEGDASARSLYISQHKRKKKKNLLDRSLTSGFSIKCVYSSRTIVARTMRTRWWLSVSDLMTPALPPGQGSPLRRTNVYLFKHDNLQYTTASPSGLAASLSRPNTPHHKLTLHHSRKGADGFLYCAEPAPKEERFLGRLARENGRVRTEDTTQRQQDRSQEATNLIH